MVAVASTRVRSVSNEQIDPNPEVKVPDTSCLEEEDPLEKDHIDLMERISMAPEFTCVFVSEVRLMV